MPDPDGVGTATSVRSLIGEGADDHTVLRDMSRNLPAAGFPTAQVRPRPLLASAQRLFDGQVLAAAARCLDQDLAGPIATWLTRFTELQAAAEATIADPTAEETVILDIQRRLASTQAVDVRMYAGDELLGTFPFRLVLTADLGVTTVRLRGGAVHQVDCTGAALEATLSFADVSPPLWRRGVTAVTLHLPLPHPVHVPLVPVPRALATAAADAPSRRRLPRR